MADHQDQESDSCSFVFIRGKNIFSILLKMHAEIALKKQPAHVSAMPPSMATADDCIM
jgi:hypothetical protein